MGLRLQLNMAIDGSMGSEVSMMRGDPPGRRRLRVRHNGCSKRWNVNVKEARRGRKLFALLRDLATQ